MSYRDDREADRARIEALEAELALAKERVAELEGRRAQALVVASGGALAPTGKASTAAARWFGAPLRLELERKFDGAYPVDRFEELIVAIREITRDRGRSELLRTSLTWWSSSSERSTGPFTCVMVNVKDGATTLAVTDRLGQLAGGIFGGVGGGVGGGGITLPILAGVFTMPVLIPVFLAGWLGGVYAGTRALYKRRARKRAEQLQRVFDAVGAEIERTLRERQAAE